MLGYDVVPHSLYIYFLHNPPRTNNGHCAEFRRLRLLQRRQLPRHPLRVVLFGRIRRRDLLQLVVLVKAAPRLVLRQLLLQLRLVPYRPLALGRALFCQLAHRLHVVLVERLALLRLVLLALHLGGALRSDLLNALGVDLPGGTLARLLLGTASRLQLVPLLVTLILPQRVELVLVVGEDAQRLLCLLALRKCFLLPLDLAVLLCLFLRPDGLNERRQLLAVLFPLPLQRVLLLELELLVEGAVLRHELALALPALLVLGLVFRLHLLERLREGFVLHALDLAASGLECVVGSALTLELRLHERCLRSALL
eukprot:PhM_4_TR5969/c0_g1_i1/m.3842